MIRNCVLCFLALGPTQTEKRQSETEPIARTKGKNSLEGPTLATIPFAMHYLELVKKFLLTPSQEVPTVGPEDRAGNIQTQQMTIIP